MTRRLRYAPHRIVAAYCRVRGHRPGEWAAIGLVETRSCRRRYCGHVDVRAAEPFRTAFAQLGAAVRQMSQSINLAARQLGAALNTAPKGSRMTTAAQAKPLIANLEPAKPSVGRIVHYQTDGRGGLRYVLPAMVVRVQGSSDKRGPLDLLPTDTHADLFVMSVDGATYGEAAVPFDDSADPAPRSWHWPPRT